MSLFMNSLRWLLIGKHNYIDKKDHITICISKYITFFSLVNSVESVLKNRRGRYRYEFTTISHYS